MISENAGGHWHGAVREHHISGISHPVRHRRRLSGRTVPTLVSKRLRLPEMQLYGILPGSRAERIPVQSLPASNVRHGQEGHAPHASAADSLVLSDRSLFRGQTQNCSGPVKNEKWGGIVHADAGRRRRHQRHAPAGCQQSCCTGCKNRMRRLQKLPEFVRRGAGRKKVRTRRSALAAQSHQQPESVSARHLSRSLPTAPGVPGRILLPLQSQKNRRSDLQPLSKGCSNILCPAALSRYAHKIFRKCMTEQVDGGL